MIPYSPAQGIKCPRVPAGRVRYLQPTEINALLGTSPRWLVLVIGLAVATGMRRSEILSVRWLDGDLTHSRIMLPQTKNGEGRIVYLNKMAKTVLESLEWNPKKPTDFVIQSCTPEQVSVAFARLCKKMGIHDFRFHDLRHTAASWLRMQGRTFTRSLSYSATKIYGWLRVTNTFLRHSSPKL